MSFTYGNDPANSDRDAVRFLLNDTTESGALLTDNEIEFLMTRGNVYFAAEAGAIKIAATYGAAVDVKVGDLELRDGSKATSYTDLATKYHRLGVSGVSPYVGAISKADRDSNREDTDWARGDFWVGSMDFAGSATIQDSTL